MDAATGAAYLVYAGAGSGQAAGFCVRLLAAALFFAFAAFRFWHCWGLGDRLFFRPYEAQIPGGHGAQHRLTGAVLVGSLQINALAAALLQNIEGVRRTLHTWSLPLGLLLDGLVGSWERAAGLSAHQPGALPGASVWGMSTQYKRILSSLASHVTRSDYRLREAKAGGRFAALFKNECGCHFGTTIYLLNTDRRGDAAGLSVYVLFVRGTGGAKLVAQMGGAGGGSYAGGRCLPDVSE